MNSWEFALKIYDTRKLSRSNLFFYVWLFKFLNYRQFAQYTARYKTLQNIINQTQRQRCLQCDKIE